jgi:hypothetical protein
MRRKEESRPETERPPFQSPFARRLTKDLESYGIGLFRRICGAKARRSAILVAGKCGLPLSWDRRDSDLHFPGPDLGWRQQACGGCPTCGRQERAHKVVAKAAQNAPFPQPPQAVLQACRDRASFHRSFARVISTHRFCGGGRNRCLARRARDQSGRFARWDYRKSTGRVRLRNRRPIGDVPGPAMG